MSTYFKIINLDKKERGLLATCISNAEAQEMIAQRIDDGRTGSIVYEQAEDGTWFYKNKGYLNYLSKQEAGAIFMHACGNLWGNKGAWYGDRVVILSDSGADSKLWEKSESWTKKYFAVALEDLSFEGRETAEEISRSRIKRMNKLSK